MNRKCERIYASATTTTILESEVINVLKEMRNNKAAGLDGIQAEMLKALDDYGIAQLTQLLNSIYETGHLPPGLLESVFITLPKKPKVMECGDFRTISLMSHIVKILLKIILKRNQVLLSENSGETQFGFKSGFGTCDATFTMRIITEKCLEKGRDLYVCFIDYAKAFDRVQHQKVFECLRNTGMDSKDLRVIANLYWNQRACIRIDNEFSDFAEIKRGVRQGCIMSPSLFKLYTECIFKNIEGMPGINISGTMINNLRYADDTVLLANNEQDLQTIVDAIHHHSMEFGLDMNVKKTKTMVISRKVDIPRVNISVNNTVLEQVSEFRYLGQNLYEDGKNHEEIRRRIGMAKTKFNQMRKVFTSRTISIATKLRLVKCYVYSTLLYCCETWTLHLNDIKRLAAFEMWIFRRLGRISWTDRKTNQNVLDHLNVTRTLMKDIKSRKLKYFGHVKRHQNIQKTMLEGIIEGRRCRGRQRSVWCDNIKGWTGMNMAACSTAAMNRTEWRSIVANLRTEDGT